ncbi:MAG: DUF4302 domain-containing protein [Capnocytophaga sp.]|nr:DUF4302 domain-containing protein [Capnocytophaga sp.]
MKNFIQSIIMLIAVLSVVSCNNRFEDDIFPEPAAARIGKSLTEYKEILVSAPNGWALENYVGGSSRTFGGYTYTMQFTDTEVTAMLDLLGTSASETTTYDVIANGGPTLTFDVYNEIIHVFSTPSASNYNAYMTDYEFLILSYENDVITMKGKKYGNMIRLVKLNEIPTAFLTKVIDTYQYVENTGILEFIMGGNKVSFTKSARTIIYTYDENGTSVSKTAAYIYTEDGIQFYEPLTINGVTIHNLFLNKTTNTLDTADGIVVFYLAQALTIDLKSTQWVIYPNADQQCSDLFNTTFDQIVAADYARWGSTLLPVIGFGLTSENGTGITFLSVEAAGTYRTVKNLVFSGTKNVGEVNIALGSNGFNWTWFTHLLPLANLIAENGPYTAELNNASNPTVVKLTSIKNPDIWFTLNQ